MGCQPLVCKAPFCSKLGRKLEVQENWDQGETQLSPKSSLEGERRAAKKAWEGRTEHHCLHLWQRVWMGGPGEHVLQPGFRGQDGAGGWSRPGRMAQALGLRDKGRWGKTKLLVYGEKLNKQSWARHVGSSNIYEGQGPRALAGRLQQTNSTAE